MTARGHMAQVLGATGLYTLTGDTPVDWELDAFQAGFAPLEQRLEAILADLFVDTASQGRIALWESLFRPQPSTADLDNCREMVKRRFAARPDGFTSEAVSELLLGAGVQGQLMENSDGTLTVEVEEVLGITQAEAQRELDQLLPSHLPWEWEDVSTEGTSD